jgi:hypothetical protein
MHNKGQGPNKNKAPGAVGTTTASILILLVGLVFSAFYGF